MVKIAVGQLEPVWFDLEATVSKTIKYIEEASSEGAELVAFPEVFIPGYPLYIWERATEFVKNVKYIKNSLSVDSPEFRRIQDAAQANAIVVVIGFSENENGSLFISQAIIEKSGEVKLKRRKCKATHVERVMYGDGNAETLKGVTPIEFSSGTYNVGCLNCWEHTQQLLNYYNATLNEDIHIGGWPPMFDQDEAPGVLYSLRKEGARSLASAYAIQNSCYYLFATGLISEEINKEIDPLPDMFNYGGGCAAIFAPDGSIISESLDPHVEGLIYANVDRDRLTLNRHLLHTVGHYSRPDLLSLQVNNSNSSIVTFKE